MVVNGFSPSDPVGSIQKAVRGVLAAVIVETDVVSDIFESAVYLTQIQRAVFALKLCIARVREQAIGCYGHKGTNALRKAYATRCMDLQ